jgi:hypothetical protein
VPVESIQHCHTISIKKIIFLVISYILWRIRLVPSLSILSLVLPIAVNGTREKIFLLSVIARALIVTASISTAYKALFIGNARLSAASFWYAASSGCVPVSVDIRTWADRGATNKAVNALTAAGAWSLWGLSGQTAFECSVEKSGLDSILLFWKLFRIWTKDGTRKTV